MLRVVASQIVAATALLPVCAQGQTNHLVDLGALTGYGINNAGQAALSTGLYANGTVTPLGALPGLTASAVPAAINAAGEIAGNEVNAGLSPCGAANSAPPAIAVLFTINAGLTSLPMPSCQPFTPGVVVAGINASGQVVGWGKFESSDENFNALIYTNGVASELAAPSSMFGVPIGGGNESQALAINDSGVVTGTVVNTTPTPAVNDAFVYDNGVWTDLGGGSGNAINASGQVTGINAQAHAFIYSAGTTTDLGALPGATGSDGTAINAAAQVAGDSGGRAFLYNGIMTDLNALVGADDPLKAFVTLKAAPGINDGGLILANGVDTRDGLTHAYLLQVPVLNISPGLLGFSSEPIGMQSGGQSITLTNLGASPIPVDSLTATGDFSVSQNGCGSSIAGSANCRVTVEFVSTASGDRSGSLTLVTGGLSFAIPMTGSSPVSVTISASPATLMTGAESQLTWTLSKGS
jgi:probable HAF family extracellular repeat protein